MSLEDAAARAEALLQQPAAPRSLQEDAVHQTLMAAIDDALTPSQREVLLAQLSGIPLGEIARRTERRTGALYKMMHDARKRLRAHLESQGHSAQSLLSDWETP